MSAEIIPCPPSMPPTAREDIVSLLLDDRRSPQTRRAYAADLRAFFGEPPGVAVDAFLSGTAPQIALELAKYKARMRNEKLAEATMNRRLAAIKSLLKFAHRLGRCCTDGSGLVDGEKVIAYRDTRGVDIKTLKKLLQAPARRYVCTTTNCVNTLSLRARAHVARDTAILTLLIENALRRAELCSLDVVDFDEAGRALWITGKGRGTQKQRVTLSDGAVAALYASLAAEKALVAHVTAEAPERAQAAESGRFTAALFGNLDRRPEHFGQRLTADGLYDLVGTYGRFVGLKKRLTPHMLRHSALTALLELTKGDVRAVQKVSRHAKIETLMIYDDNRADVQGELTGQLSAALK